MAEPVWMTVHVHACVDLGGGMHEIETSQGRFVTHYDDAPAWAEQSAGGEPQRILVEGGRMRGIGFARPRTHPITLQLIEALDLDRDGLVAWLLKPHVWADDGDLAIPKPEGAGERNEGELIVETVLPGMVVVQGGICLPGRRMPETTLALCGGRVLRDVASLPDLEHLDIPILRASNLPSGFGLCFDLVPEDGHIPLTAPTDEGGRHGH